MIGTQPPPAAVDPPIARLSAIVILWRRATEQAR